MSEQNKKIILWSATVILAAGLIFLWLKISQKRFENFQLKEFIQELNFPEIKIDYGKISTTTE